MEQNELPSTQLLSTARLCLEYLKKEAGQNQDAQDDAKVDGTQAPHFHFENEIRIFQKKMRFLMIVDLDAYRYYSLFIF